jgi:hypothetical protein
MIPIVTAARILFHYVNHQLSHHKIAGKGTVCGVVCQIKSDTPAQRLFRTAYATIKNIDICLVQTVLRDWKTYGQKWCRASSGV